ncbi:hypothetical protein ABZ595_25035 [Streptomyces rubradiris]|uniref:hypothetical protein n=1 Tax=Streptomyces rubradiris TaxID=285531 RepID=UPI0033E75DF1
MDEQLERARALGAAAEVIRSPDTPSDVKDLLQGLMGGIADQARAQLAADKQTGE